MAIQPHGHEAMKTKTFELEGLCCVCCAEDVERALRAQTVITSAKVGYLQGVATVTYREDAGHMGMDHDMSDPKMARAMEVDMRNRFWLALVLTIPTLLYSPLFTQFFGIRLPAPIDPNWIMLILSTPVVWWAGWMFISG